MVIYEAFVEGRLEAPKHLARTVHDLYFEPTYEEFRSRTILVSLQCVYVSIQGARSRPTIQGDGQAGRIPRGPVLTIVLTGGAVSEGRPLFDQRALCGGPTPCRLTTARLAVPI